MAKYKIVQHRHYDDFHNRWHMFFVIQKKHWLWGWCTQTQVEDENEVKEMLNNLVSQGHTVIKDWTVTDKTIQI